LRLLDSRLEFLAIAGERCQFLFLPIKGDDHGAILGPQLFQESLGSLLNVVEHPAGAQAGVEH
jgi:hypothetical protein